MVPTSLKVVPVTVASAFRAIFLPSTVPDAFAMTVVSELIVPEKVTDGVWPVAQFERRRALQLQGALRVVDGAAARG